MEQFKQPVPTEYEGVVYKSKSEALLARCFDLVKEVNGENAALIPFYEPKQLTLPDGYVPDFFIMQTLTMEGFTPYLTSHILEYKPTGVTDTYRDKLIKRFRHCHEILYKAVPFEVQAHLLIGSCYGASKRELYFFEGYNFRKSHLKGWDYLGITDEIIEQALEYRFDLIH